LSIAAAIVAAMLGADAPGAEESSAMLSPQALQEIAQVEAEIDRIEAQTVERLAVPPDDHVQQIELLGKLMLYDKELSINRNEACAFCHMPETGFTGPVAELNRTAGSDGYAPLSPARIKDLAAREPSDYRRHAKESTTVMNRTSPTLAFGNWKAPRLSAGIAIIIFAIDTFIPFDIAIAVLYVIVVLMAANFLRRRGVILVSLACVTLTVLSFMLQHGYSDGSEPIGRGLVSLAAIGITTFLALKRQRVEDALRRSETYLAEAQRLSRTGSFSWKIATEEQYWSEETFRILEYDVAMKPTLGLVLRRIHPDDASVVQQAIERAPSGQQNIDVTHRLLMPDGSVKHVRALAHPTRDAAGNVEYVGALIDITAAKRAEEALRQAQTALAHVTRVTTLGETDRIHSPRSESAARRHRHQRRCRPAVA
jgi:PAS domain-containing protein